MFAPELMDLPNHPRMFPLTEIKRAKDGFSLVCVSPKDVDDVVKHIKAFQVESPLTHVCVIVKMTPAVDSTLFKGWTVLTEWGKNHRFHMPGYEMPRCCKQRVRAYYLPPCYGTRDVSLNVLRKPRRNIKMAFMGKVNGQPARVLLDSGADQVYLSLQFSRHLGIEVTKEVKTVTLGDNQEISTHGGAKVTVTMANCTTRWPCQVIPLNSNYDIILGDDWLEHHEACLNYRDGTVTLHEGRRRFTLRQQSESCFVPDTKPPSCTEPPPKLLNAIQLKRRLVKGRCE